MVVLSRREGQVLQLLIQGKTQKEAAMILCISPHTVNVYVCAIIRKLGAVNLVQAVHLAHCTGIVQTPEYTSDSASGNVNLSDKDCTHEGGFTG